MLADLDDLLTALYLFADDLLPGRPPSRPGRRPRISDAEAICLAVAEMLLDCPKERRFLRFAGRRLGHLFPYIPNQSGHIYWPAGSTSTALIPPPSSSTPAPPRTCS